MLDLFKFAYRGAQIAHIVHEGCDSSKELDEWTSRGAFYQDVDVVGVLYQTCSEATCMPHDLRERPLEEQWAVWHALGILSVAQLMPEFWKEGLADCAEDALSAAAFEANSDNSEVTEGMDELTEILEGIGS